MVDMGRALLLVAQEMKLGFVLHGKALSLEEVFAEKGLLPSIMRRSDQLSSFCLGYGLGLTFEDSSSARLGVVVKSNDEVPNAMRLMCAPEIFFDLAESAADRSKKALDDQMYY